MISVRNFSLWSNAVSLIPEISPDSWPCSSSQGELVPSCGHLSCCLRSQLNQTKFPETVNPVVCVCTEDVDVIHTFLKKKKKDHVAVLSFTFCLFMK